MTHDNKVELIGIHGSDLTHACSAWTSTERELTEDKLRRYPALLEMLLTEGHETPFEKSYIHFLVTTDIATHIHMLKHRIGVSINAESARYKELGERKRKGVLIGDNKFYLPTDWPEENREELKSHIESSYEAYKRTIKDLVDKGYSRKRAKESARFFLPYGIQLTADVSFNFRSFLHFQRLRNSEHAQLEVRRVAQEMLRLVELSEQMPVSVDLLKKLTLE